MLGTSRAAPRRKRIIASDFTIKNAGDWESLKQGVKSGKHFERVAVEPADPELIRNLQFTEGLAELAASNKFVVELAGGILSHAYYHLQSRGAQVECTDLFGTDEEVLEYNKVVRDKIPESIEARGEHVETVQLRGNALVAALRQKLVEEAFEALDAKSGDDLIGELADVEEVVVAIGKSLQLAGNKISAERRRKRARRGGFDRGLMLVKTATPHSIQKQPALPIKVRFYCNHLRFPGLLSRRVQSFQRSRYIADRICAKSSSRSKSCSPSRRKYTELAR